MASCNFESFAVFLTVDCCFWWEKFTQQEAFTIPEQEHGHHWFFCERSNKQSLDARGTNTIKV
jgi:hypothetical protein